MLILWAKKRTPSSRITNFGGNVSFAPRHDYTPRDEAEVLGILDNHANGKIRVRGSLHSWSGVAETDDVSIDMRQFDGIEVETTPSGEAYATVGAGWVLQDLLDTLRENWNLTLPTIGSVTRQTISGIISTATHGSGEHTLSHYMDEIRIAAYDSQTGKAKVFVWDGGQGLRAARCAVGCMGVILSVKFKCVPMYYVEENVITYNSIEEVISREEQYPLQQFLAVPYSWLYYSFQRRVETNEPSPAQELRARIQRLINLVIVDAVFHGILKMTVKNMDSPWKVKLFYKVAFAFTTRDKVVIDRSDKTLTLKHHYYRHVEMEISVPASNIVKANELIKSVTSIFAGESDNVTEEVENDLKSVGLYESLMSRHGSYVHHYPIVFRLLLPDDALISMSSGTDERYYAVSLFTFMNQREGFFDYAGFLARSLAALYGARLHWGKYFPLSYDEIANLYPQLEEFCETCDNVDPNGVFRNDYTNRVLGL